MPEIETKLLRLCSMEDLSVVAEAARIIRRGGLVAFPTETVYGLGANALDPKAVSRIFAAKGRPGDNPLIVHIARKEALPSLVGEVPMAAQTLMEHFWPGPLTLIFPKRPLIPKETTAGLSTVAVRMPAHPVALALIDLAGVPIAAPSANLSGKPSPTTAQHVYDDLKGRIEMVLDGGKTEVGLESTVLDITVQPPILLRPGGVTLEELGCFIPEITVDPGIGTTKPRAPGMKYTHYAPNAEVIVVEGPRDAVQRKIQDLASHYHRQGLRVGIMATWETAEAYGEVHQVEVVGGRDALAAVAANLYSCFHRFNQLEVDLILAEGFQAFGLGLAIMNRLRKAAGYRIIKAG